MIVAIDGPSGAGKSSVAQAVAQRLGIACLDTGAMYRSIAWAALEQGVPTDDAEQLGRIAGTSAIAFHRDGGDGPERVSLAGTDVTEAIRTAAVDRAVSPVSAHRSVREALVGQQRRIGAAGDYVVEGRDIGTVVFPDARVKVFLTATDEARARRRVAQNEQRGIGSVDFDEVLRDIRARDAADSARAESPLMPAADAVTIDTSDLAFDEVVARIVGLAAGAQGGR